MQNMSCVLSQNTTQRRRNALVCGRPKRCSEDENHSEIRARYRWTGLELYRIAEDLRIISNSAWK